MGHHYIICYQRIPADYNRDPARLPLLHQLLHQHDHPRLDLLRQLGAGGQEIQAEQDHEPQEPGVRTGVF